MNKNHINNCNNNILLHNSKEINHKIPIYIFKKKIKKLNIKKKSSIKN